MIILLIILIILLFGGLPIYPYSRSYGYYPSGIVFVLLIILLFFMFSGRHF